jgi:hypothetical protein
MGLKLKSDLQALLDETKAAQETVKAASAQTTTAAEKATTTLQEIVTVSQSASAHAATTEQNETTSTKQVSIAKTSTADIQALELKIKEFYAQIDQYREKIDTTSTDAQKAVEGNTLQTKSLIGTLDQLEARIKDQIEKATGYSLFHSFQTRQESLAKAKYVWGVVLAILVAFSMGLSAYVIQSTTDFSVAFYLKLSMSIPLIYAISFCTIQYSRERKLEEEYAFKSAISISLDPYQTLVNRIINQDKPAEREKFTDFIVDSIKKVFTSPTDKIFEPKERNKGVNEKSLKQVAEIVGSVTKAMKP